MNSGKLHRDDWGLTIIKLQIQFEKILVFDRGPGIADLFHHLRLGYDLRLAEGKEFCNLADCLAERTSVGMFSNRPSKRNEGLGSALTPNIVHPLAIRHLGC